MLYSELHLDSGLISLRSYFWLLHKAVDVFKYSALWCLLSKYTDIAMIQLKICPPLKIYIYISLIHKTMTSPNLNISVACWPHVYLNNHIRGSYQHRRIPLLSFNIIKVWAYNITNTCLDRGLRLFKIPAINHNPEALQNL